MTHARSPRRALLAALTTVAVLLVSAGVAVVAPGPAEAVTLRAISGHVSLGDLGRSATAGEVKVSYLRYGYTPGPAQFVYTDSAGNYSITGLAPASYSVRFDYTGLEAFGSLVWPDRAPSSPTAGNFVINLTNADKTGADAVLPRPADVGGTVYLGSSPAAAGEVAVYYESLTASNWSGAWQAPPVYTDADGRYELTNLTSGVYKIWFDYLGDGPFQDVYYGNGSSPWAYTSVQIASEADIVRDMTLPGRRTISGWVTLEDPGNHVPGGSVKAGAGEVEVSWAYSPTSDGEWVWVEEQSVTTDANGTYVIPDLLWGYYLVRMTYTGSAGRYLTVTRGETWSPLSMVGTSIQVNGSLNRLYGVSGHVDIGDQGTSAAAGEATVRLVASYGTIATTTTDENGDFAFPNVTSRTDIALSVTKPGTGWRQYVSANFDLDADLSMNALVERTGRFFGVMRDEFGRPLEGYVWGYVCEDGKAVGWGADFSTRTDTSGRYWVDTPGYGEYLLIPSPDDRAYTTRWSDPDEVKCIDTHGGGDFEVNHYVPRAGAVQGRLSGPGLTATDLGQLAVSLWLFQPGDSPGVPRLGDWISLGYTAYPDAMGRYSFGDLPPGMYAVTVQYGWHSVRVVQPVPVSVRGTVRNRDLTIPSLAGIRVAGASAAAIAGATGSDSQVSASRQLVVRPHLVGVRNFAGRDR